ncbi:LpqB family beta-propeller domain-containing protein [Micromonospora sp. NPDC049559]|uniref:LpqB family beta-propeller domain-containing protein n=1 Tax=Micromonospora sp. NPDC049559 TaxID=3155923 RepID=UPI003446BFDA
MRRLPLLAASASMLLVTVLTGCGIPDETDVRVDGQVPTLKYDSPYGDAPPIPPQRLSSGDDVSKFVTNFLQAAAGESNKAYQRVRDYLVPSRQGDFKEKQGGAQINVVRLRTDVPLVTEDSSSSSVTIEVQQVGVLRADGTLAPPVLTDSRYTFKVGKADPNDTRGNVGLYLLEPPPALLLSDDAIKKYYREQTVYFWNSERSALVPDLRYLPLEVPPQRRATEVLGWLIRGPADWLTSTAVPLPDGTEQIGTVPQTGDRIEVNLSALPGPDEEAELNRLATQFAWSLPPDLHGKLELKIRNQTRRVIDVGQERNDHRPSTAAPQRYCVYGGMVRPLTIGEQNSGTPIAPALNHDVVSAALARGAHGVLAALVTATDDGRRRLQVGVGPVQVEGVTPGAKTYASMSRPVWLRGGDPEKPVGLVVADGVLYRFQPGDPALAQVALPDAPGPVTSVAAALEGSRIAFVAGGRLYVAALTAESGAAGTGPALTVGPARQVVTSLTDLSGLDWSSEQQLLVAGTAPENRRPAIYEINLDGGVETTFAEQLGSKVTNLAAYPMNTVTARVLYEVNKVSWYAQYNNFIKIERDAVAGAPPPAPGVTANITAPFFYY